MERHSVAIQAVVKVFLLRSNAQSRSKIQQIEIFVGHKMVIKDYRTFFCARDRGHGEVEEDEVDNDEDCWRNLIQR